LTRRENVTARTELMAEKHFIFEQNVKGEVGDSRSEAEGNTLLPPSCSASIQRLDLRCVS
jgi:hypothetical protein